MGGKGKSRMKVTKVKAKARDHSESVECGCGNPKAHHHQHRPGGNPQTQADMSNALHKKLASIARLPVIEGPVEISITDLVIGQYHKNRVLSGTFCVEPFFINCVHTVLEDKFGNTVRVLIDDEGVSISRQNSKILARYAKGRNVHIKEPYYKVCIDGGTAVRVENQGDISADSCQDEESTALSVSKVNVNDSPSKHGIKFFILDGLDSIRSEGNRLFVKQDWKGALSEYSKCVLECVRLLGKAKVDNRIVNDVVLEEFSKLSGTSEEYSKLRETLLLAYSNRSETWLRLRNYDEALSDAGKALELDAKHVKSLVRKGKALQELQLYLESAGCFNAALQESPDDSSIQAALARVTTSHQQSQEGVYNLSDYYLGLCPENPPPCSDFVGPVEIQCRGGGRRGLFATRDFASGDLLLVSNAIAVCRRDRKTSDSDDDGCGSCECEYHQEFGRRNSRYMADLAAQLKVFSNSSRRRMAQVSVLSGAEHSIKVDIPSMDLFRPGKQWTPPSSNKTSIDSESYKEIVRQNCINEIPNDPTYFMTGKSEELLSGLWLLPSMMNHSCCANSETWLVGNAMFVHACRAISAGEELTRSYFDTLKGLERRQEASKRWWFKCNCERCEWESNIPESQSKIRKKLCSRVHKFFFEAYAAPYPPNMEKLAGVVASVEETIESVKLEGRFRHWIRASLMDAYIADVHVLVGIPTRRIEAIKRVLDAMTAVGGGLSLRLQISATLLREVKRKHGKASPVFRSTEEYVMELYKPFCGELNRKTFLALAKLHAGGDGLD